MGIATEKLGVFDDLQSKGLKYLPQIRLVKAQDERVSALEEAARKAVDEAIAAAVQRAVDRRQEEIERLLSPGGPPLESIMEAVSTATGISANELLGKCRMVPVGRARWLFWYVASALRRDLSLVVLGKATGGKDHTSVIHGIRRFPEARNEYPLRDWCNQPSIVELLAAADDKPRRV